jgi:hypothetical protein
LPKHKLMVVVSSEGLNNVYVGHGIEAFDFKRSWCMEFYVDGEITEHMQYV